jgi:hypothetical protein
MKNSVLQQLGTLGPHSACYLFIYLLIYGPFNEAVGISEYSIEWQDGYYNNNNNNNNNYYYYYFTASGL